MNEQTGTRTISPARKAIIAALIITGSVIFFLLFSAKGDRPGGRILREGDSAPEFKLPLTDGRYASLSDYRGKVVMVHFWATWCPPCVEEIPLLENLYQRLSRDDFELLAVNLDDGSPQTVAGFMANNKMTMPVLLDPRRSVAKLYGTFKYPETYIIDRNGIVKYKVIGARDWTDPSTVKILQDMMTPAR